jgi:hypothetical protein
MVSLNAAKDAKERFDLVEQTNCYLEWYESILGNRHNANGDFGRALNLRSEKTAL